LISLHSLAGEASPGQLPLQPKYSLLLFWISDILMGIAYLWFTTTNLGTKPAVQRGLGLIFGATLIAAIIINSTEKSGAVTVLFPISAAMTKLASFGLFLRTKKLDGKFLVALPLVLLIGLDIPVYLSLPSLLIFSALALSIIGFMYSTLWLGLIQPMMQRTEALQLEIKNSQAAKIEIETLNNELIEAYNTTLEGWARALELRDKETEGHSRRVSDLSNELGMAMGLSEEDQMHLHFGSLLHDIGKMAIQDEILLKPGKLTKEERAIIEKHPEHARSLLEGIKFLENALVIPTYHHERWDGSGYPAGLAAEEIPLLARVFAVVDVWDALTSDRPYSQAWSHAEAKAYITNEAGVHFDPRIVDIFFKKVIHE
jgi:hypothetical protein